MACQISGVVNWAEFGRFFAILRARFQPTGQPLSQPPAAQTGRRRGSTLAENRRLSEASAEISAISPGTTKPAGTFSRAWHNPCINPDYSRRVGGVGKSLVYGALRERRSKGARCFAVGLTPYVTHHFPRAFAPRTHPFEASMRAFRAVKHGEITRKPIIQGNTIAPTA